MSHDVPEYAVVISDDEVPVIITVLFRTGCQYQRCSETFIEVA